MFDSSHACDNAFTGDRDRSQYPVFDFGCLCIFRYSEFDDFGTNAPGFFSVLVLYERSLIGKSNVTKFEFYTLVDVSSSGKFPCIRYNFTFELESSFHGQEGVLLLSTLVSAW